MWGLEHAALAYLVILPIYLILRRHIEPRILIFIFAFANLADAMHFGQFRFWLHNTPGLIIAFIIAIIIFMVLKSIQVQDIPVLGLAVITHVVSDLLFSNFYIYYPIDSVGYNMYGWMTPEHILAGSILIPIFLIVFVCIGDYGRLRRYVNEHEEEFLSNLQSSRKQKKDMWPYYVFFFLRIFLGIQLLLLAMEIMLLSLDRQFMAWILLALSMLVYFMVFGLSIKTKA